MSDLDRRTQEIWTLMMGALFVAGGIILWWAGRRITERHWPSGQAKAVWSLLGSGIAGVALGLNLVTWVQASWGQTIGTICIQLAVLVLLTSGAWLNYLFERYPLEPSIEGNEARSRDMNRVVALDSIVIALPVSYAAFSVLYWTSSITLALGAGFAAFVLALCIAWPVLYRLLHQRSPRQ